MHMKCTPCRLTVWQTCADWRPRWYVSGACLWTTVIVSFPCSHELFCTPSLVLRVVAAAGHVMINRVDRRSQLECLKQCGELLKQVRNKWACWEHAAMMRFQMICNCIAGLPTALPCSCHHSQHAMQHSRPCLQHAVCLSPPTERVFASHPTPQGASVLFFPEGTRSKDGRMHAFKKGAFSVAAKAKVCACRA